MVTLGPLGFSAPWLLAAGLGLPALWFLLRAVPPRLREVVFPGTALLQGLPDPAPVARRTPWWMLLMRVAAVAAVILALAGPVWRPGPQVAGTGPLLILVDAGWGAAPNWQAVMDRARQALDQAQAEGRPVALWLADGQGGRGEGPVPGLVADAAALLRAAVPQPWATRYPGDPAAFLRGAPARLDTLWLTDGADHPGRGALLSALAARGEVTVVPPARPLRALSLSGGTQPALTIAATAAGPLPAVLALGPDPRGVPRQLARLTPPAAQPVPGGGFAAQLPIDLPPELRNRVTRLVLEGESSAGAVVLADDRVRRPKVALVGDGRATEGQALLSPLHYLREALVPAADLVEGSLDEVLPAAPDVVVLVDGDAGARTGDLLRWVEAGGMLIRFAGPRMAADPELADDPLLPVRLRPGGRAAGGALSWGDPRPLAPFAGDGPFAGLDVPADVTVRAQLLPDPGPDLPAHVIAQLADGTPLVTRAGRGQGQLVLFHSSANAEWSNLALSGLFGGMLDRVIRSARLAPAAARAPGSAAPEVRHWRPEQVLDGFGRLHGPGALSPVPAALFARGAGPGAPAGLYAAGERRAALNAGEPLVPAASWPGARVERGTAVPGTPLGGALLALAGLLLAADALASAMIAGARRMAGRRARGTVGGLGS